MVFSTLRITYMFLSMFKSKLRPLFFANAIASCAEAESRMAVQAKRSGTAPLN